MPLSRSLRALVEAGRIHVQLPGAAPVSLSPAEAARLARQLLALGPVRDHEALEVARVLAEDLALPGPPGDDELPPLS